MRKLLCSHIFYDSMQNYVFSKFASGYYVRESTYTFLNTLMLRFFKCFAAVWLYKLTHDSYDNIMYEKLKTLSCIWFVFCKKMWQVSHKIQTLEACFKCIYVLILCKKKRKLRKTIALLWATDEDRFYLCHLRIVPTFSYICGLVTSSNQLPHPLTKIWESSLCPCQGNLRIKFTY